MDDGNRFFSLIFMQHYTQGLSIKDVGIVLAVFDTPSPMSEF